MEHLKNKFTNLPWSTANEKKISELISLSTLCEINNESTLLSIQYFHDIPSSIWENELIRSHEKSIPVILASKFYELEPFHSSAIQTMDSGKFFDNYSLAEVLCLQSLDYCLYRMDLVNAWIKLIKLLQNAKRTNNECDLVFFCFLKVLSHLKTLQNIDFDIISKASLSLADMYEAFNFFWKDSNLTIDLNLIECAQKIIRERSMNDNE